MIETAVQSSLPRSIAVLGATGSIGRATLDVIRSLGNHWHAFGLSAHSQLDQILRIAPDFQTRLVVGTCSDAQRKFASLVDEANCQVEFGQDALVQLATHPEVDTVVAAIVGSAGMLSTLAAAKAGKRIALANKESLVVAGSLVRAAVTENNAELIPVDSEHSAIYQALQSGKPGQVGKIVLTASGGPFRTLTKSALEQVSVSDALVHPTWQMGRKITIDSATMMNKALEVIEAHWLFGLPAEQIDVVIHPQSIVHSMVEFVDGSTIAQMSPPDMRLPIQYALTFPERTACPSPKMNWRQECELTFQPVDLDRFPAVSLGWEVIRRGGSTGAVVNAANEAAVQLFLEGKLRFVDIVPACRRVLDQHDFEPKPDLTQLLSLDQWSRQEIYRFAERC